MGKPTTRWGVRLMNDKGAAISRFAREKPRVPVRATVQFSSIWHSACPFLALKHSEKYHSAVDERFRAGA